MSNEAEAYLRTEGEGAKGRVFVNQFIFLVNRESKAMESDEEGVEDKRILTSWSAIMYQEGVVK